MIIKVFSIYDSKSLIFAHPSFHPTKGAAIRWFADLVQKPDSAIGRHASDFTLFLCGEFDDSTGIFTSLRAPENLVMATDFVNQDNNSEEFESGKFSNLQTLANDISLKKKKLANLKVSNSEL